ncbi:MAG: hypothetical protein ABDH21_03635 [bacterium]
MNKIFDWILLNSPEHIKLSLYPKSIDKIFSRDFISKIDQEDIYRTSAGLSVYRKDVLRDLLREGESAWDFEIYGTSRSRKYSNFYTVNKEVIKVVNGVVRGKSNYHSLNILKNLGIVIQSSSRPKMGRLEAIGAKLSILKGRLLYFFPPTIRKSLMNINWKVRGVNYRWM